jgi:hypothetical protein
VDSSGRKHSATRSTVIGEWVLLAGVDAIEANDVQGRLAESGGRVICYPDLRAARRSMPGGCVVLAVLGPGVDTPQLEGDLRWLRKHWPRCCMAVVGDGDGLERERTARCGGAMYFARPVQSTEWTALLAQVTGEPGGMGRAEKTRRNG